MVEWIELHMIVHLSNMNLITVELIKFNIYYVLNISSFHSNRKGNFLGLIVLIYKSVR